MVKNLVRFFEYTLYRVLSNEPTDINIGCVLCNNEELEASP